MRRVVGAHDMRSVERAAIHLGVSVESMIQCAGTAVANAAAEMAQGGQILVLVGPGNNGSDGLVAAERLRRSGSRVEVYCFRRAGPGEYEGSMTDSDHDPEGDELRRLLSGSTVVVDALLGIGQSRAPAGTLREILQIVTEPRSNHLVAIAVDIPTGVNADTGVVADATFVSDLTLCMGYVKQGLVLSPGRESAGRVLTVDVGIPETLDESLHVSTPAASDIAAMLPNRKVDGNKGTYGRLVVIGGSADFVGAPALVTNGAYRAGAGLVEVAIPSSIQPYVAAHTLEAIYRPLKEQSGQVAFAALDTIRETLRKARALVYGPGLGDSEGTRLVTREVLRVIDDVMLPAAVVDADGLNCLSQLPDWYLCKTPLVLTPHPGEMSRLTGRSIDAIQQNRVECAMHYANRWGKVVVLKGAGTVIASPDGQAVINPTGGPNLSTAGTGDVLSGIIGGLLAQGCSPFEAAIAGVYVHGAAGDRLRERYGDAGTIASDLFTAIPEALLAIQGNAGGRT